MTRLLVRISVMGGRQNDYALLIVAGARDRSLPVMSTERIVTK
jgi:hypothetical protein